MKMLFSKRMMMLLVLAASVGLGTAVLGLNFGCGTVGPGTTLSGGTPAVPPTPPAEIPASLTIPSGSSLSINIDRIASGAPPALEGAALKAVVTSNGEFKNIVEGIGDEGKFVEDDLNSLLDPYTQLIIPVGTNIKTFKPELSVVGQKGSVIDFAEISIDFADFDIDNDGFTEGCSGNTEQLPICMRIWADGKKQMAAVFTAYPTKENPGAGRLVGLNITDTTFLFPENGFLEITYDHHDPASGVMTDLATREADPAGFRVHFFSSQEGGDATAVKSLGVSFTGGKLGTDSVQALMKFREDVNLLSGNLHFEPPGGSDPDMVDQCVDILTGNGLDSSLCVSAFIDVADVPFLDFPDETTLFLPNEENFPNSPTF
jgi:hypothetical protein